MKNTLFIVEFFHPDSDGNRMMFMRAANSREAIIMALAERIEYGLSEAITTVYEFVGKETGGVAISDPSKSDDWFKLRVPASISIEHSSTFSR
jgi:hypothetical protein